MNIRNTAVVIPARYQSKRFPGKPLVEIAGKPMILHVWERCVLAAGRESVFIATDDKRIADICRDAGATVVMTSEDCLTGTDRVAQAARQIPAQLYVNVQGDEPCIPPEDIRTVIGAAEANPTSIHNGMCRITSEQDYRNRNIPKVVSREDGRLLYMSRAPIPAAKSDQFHFGWRQVCTYAFPPEALEAFASRPTKGRLEEVEDIEILRFLELGWDVRMVEVSSNSISVDIPEDLDRVRLVLQQR